MHHDPMAMEGSCPLELAGTSVRATDVDGGAALEFTTTGDVAELRKRVAHMAEMHAKMGGEMMGGGMMGGAGAGSCPMMSMHAGAHSDAAPATPR